MVLSMEQLNNHATEFLAKHFDLQLNIPIKLNGRLKVTQGRFRYRTKPTKQALDIELSLPILIEETDEFSLKTLEHELVHYALFELNLPHSDSDMTFINKCNDLNVPLTRTRSANIKKHHYVCADSCKYHNDHVRVKRLSKKYTYKCTKCNETLTYDGFY